MSTSAAVAAYAGVSQTVTSYINGQTANMLARHNALMAEFGAKFERIKTDFNIKRLREEGRRVKGSALVAAGASGFATDEGSNLDAVADIARGVELDAVALRISGDIEVGQLRSGAALSRLTGRLAEQEGRTEAASTLLSTTAKFVESKGD